MLLDFTVCCLFFVSCVLVIDGRALASVLYKLLYHPSRGLWGSMLPVSEGFCFRRRLGST